MEEEKAETIQAVQEDVTLAPPKKAMKSYLPHNRYIVIDYPGVANVRVGTATYPGNRCIRFGQGMVAGLAPEDQEALEAQVGSKFDIAPAEYLFNMYFLHRANLIITDWRCTDETISVMITTQLEREQVDDMMLVQNAVESQMRELREKREEEKKKQATEEEKAKADAERLIKLGSKAEKQGWEKRITELEESVTALNKELKNAKRKK